MRISPPVGGPRLEPPGDAADGLFPSSALMLISPVPPLVIGDTPSELLLWAILGPSLPDTASDSEADSAEEAAALMSLVRLPRIRAGIDLTLLSPSVADAPPLVALTVSGVDAAPVADEDAIAMREEGRGCAAT